MSAGGHPGVQASAAGQSYSVRLFYYKLRSDRGAVGLPFVGALAICAVVALVGLGIAALLNQDESTAGGPVDVMDILNNRGEYFGEQVSVRGPIDEILGPKAFTIAAPDEDRGSLLVFTDKPLEAQKPGWVSDDAVVAVEGEVHYRDSREIGKRVDGLDDSDLEVAADDPVVLASRVKVTRREEPAAAGPTVEELTKQPSKFLGKLVTVAGPAERVINDHAFILEPGLLVVGRLNGLAGVEKGEYVEVTGAFERYSSFEELDRKLDGRLTDQDLKPFVGRPIVIARIVNFALPAGEVSRGVDEESLE